MEQVDRHHAATPGLLSRSVLWRWVAAALLMLALPGLAQAACGTMNVPDSYTTPTTNPMASGGSITVDASRCDLFGLNPYPNPGTSPPSHGSVSVNTVQGTITYINSGDGATSDSFVVEDASNLPFTVNVAIGASTSPISVSPGTLPDTTDGIPYSQTLTATGGTAPYTWSIDSGALPPLMSLSSTGTISGTTNTNGSFNFSVRVDDDAGNSAIKGYTIDSPGPNIQVTTNLPDPVRGIPYSQTMQAYPGTPPFTYDTDGTSLPAGLTLTPAGLLSGIPTGSGPTTFEIAAHDSSVDAGNGDNYFGLRSYTLTTLDPPPLTLSPAGSFAATVGGTFVATISASGGVAPYSYALSAGALPAGLALNTGSGVISGTPTAGGSFNFTITATDSNSTGAVTGAQPYTLSVAAPAITINPATLADGTVGTAYSQAISASGGTAPYSFAITAGSLPSGLTLSALGVLSGTPTAFGTFNFTISATDSSTGAGPYSQARAYALTIDSATPIAGPVSASVAYGSGANPITLNITGGAATSVAVASAAGNGTAVASGTTITYQPNAGYAGPDSFSYTASNADGTSAPATVTITVSPPTLSLSPAAGTLNADYGVAYSQTFSASGGAAPYSYAPTGTLPPGLSLNAASGVVSGTPTAPGSYPVTITATDSSTGSGAPFSVANNYTFVVAAPTITLAPAILPDGTAGAAYSQTITASGGIGPYTFTITAGALPNGMSLASDGTLSGTPTASGVFNFSVTATDANGQTGSRAYTLTIATATLSVTPTSLPNGSVGAAYSQSFSTTGGVAPYTYAINSGALPPGTTLNATGVLSGTPTASGNFAFDLLVTDSSSGTAATATVSYTLTIDAPTITLTPATLPDGQVDSAYSEALAASGGTPPYSYAITSGALPAGVNLNTASGVISGTPTTAGSVSFEVTATDSSTGSGAPFTGAVSYSIDIADAVPIANSVSASVAYGSGANPITLNLSGGPADSVAVATVPTHGTALASGTTMTYQPDAGYAGPDSFTYTATNASGTSAPATVSITVGAATLSLSPPAGALSASYAVAYSQTFAASGGAAPYSYAVTTGTLPTGLNLDSASGVLSGTPTAPGSFAVTITATDSSTGAGAPFSVAGNYSFDIALPTITLGPATLPDGTSGVAYNQTITASGGIGPYTYALVAGSLPGGMSLASDGTLSGAPFTNGSSSFTVQATDANGYTGSFAFTLVIGTPAFDATPIPSLGWLGLCLLSLLIVLAACWRRRI